MADSSVRKDIKKSLAKSDNRDVFEKALDDENLPSVLGAIGYGLPATILGGIVGKRFASRSTRDAERRAFEAEQNAMIKRRNMTPEEDAAVTKAARNKAGRGMTGATIGALGGSFYGSIPATKKRRK